MATIYRCDRCGSEHPERLPVVQMASGDRVLPTLRDLCIGLPRGRLPRLKTLPTWRPSPSNKLAQRSPTLSMRG